MKPFLKQANNIEEKQLQKKTGLSIQVQPGDAKQHMLRSISKEQAHQKQQKNIKGNQQQHQKANQRFEDQRPLNDFSQMKSILEKGSYQTQMKSQENQSQYQPRQYGGGFEKIQENYDRSYQYPPSNHHWQHYSHHKDRHRHKKHSGHHGHGFHHGHGYHHPPYQHEGFYPPPPPPPPYHQQGFYPPPPPPPYHHNSYHHPHPPPPFHGDNPPFHPPQPNAFQSQMPQLNQAVNNSQYPQPPIASQYCQPKGCRADKHKQRGDYSRCQKRDYKRKHHKKHCRSSSSSRSRSSSDSSSDGQENEKTKSYLKQISVFYNNAMNGFFESRAINLIQRQKIIKKLRSKYPKFDAPIETLFNALQDLQSQKLLFQMSYLKVIKVLIKYKFNLPYAIPKIAKIQEKKIHKYQADVKFQAQYGGLQVQPCIQLDELINKDPTNLIFLIDGNNILPTTKYFRKYFQSGDFARKLEVQIRCRWLISHAISKHNCTLFFDEKYNEGDYKSMLAYLMPNTLESERTNGIEVIYGQKESADNRIVEKVEQLAKELTSKEIILVSADRDLYMRCLEKKKISHTGGKYFFKYIKYRALKSESGKQHKKLVKGIFKPTS